MGKYVAACYRRINGRAWKCSIQILPANGLANLRRQAKGAA